MKNIFKGLGTRASSAGSRGGMWWIFALAIVILDQSTKAVIQALFPYGSAIAITPFFNIGHWRNTGAAFSFLADAGGWQRYFFVALAVAVCTWLAFELQKPSVSAKRWGLILILGGAAANGIDRALQGYVTDFLDFYWRNLHWPSFNIADMAIVGGATLVALMAFQPEPKHPDR